MKSERTIKLMLAYLSGSAIRAAEDGDEETRQLLVDLGETLVWVLSDEQPELITNPFAGEILAMLNEFQKSIAAPKN